MIFSQLIIYQDFVAKVLRTALSAVFSCLFLGLFWACTDDLETSESRTDSEIERISDGSIYLSLDFATLSDSYASGTRYADSETTPPSDYDDVLDREPGQSWENEVKTLQVILFSEVKGNVIRSFTYPDTQRSAVLTSTDNINYTFKTALTKEEAEDIKTNYGETFTCKIYVICNPVTAAPATGDPDFQKVLTVESPEHLVQTYGGYFYASDPESGQTVIDYKNFLMTNGDFSNANDDASRAIYTQTINMDEVLATTGINNPYKLNPGDKAIPVQRALARIDLDPITPVEYFDANGDYMASQHNNAAATGWALKIEMKYAALTNLSTKFNLFKETGNPEPGGLKGSDWGYFWSEVASKTAGVNNNYIYTYRYVLDPQYQLKKTVVANSPGAANTYFHDQVFGAGANWMRDYTNYDYDDDGGNPVRTGAKFSLLSNLTNTIFGDKVDANKKNATYKIWRYASPNTIHEAAMQKNAISTGIVYVAKMTFNDNNDNISRPFGAHEGEEATPIYMWNGKFYWTNRYLQQVVNKGAKTAEEQSMANAYNEAIKSATDEDSFWLSAGDLNSALEGEDETVDSQLFYLYLNRKPSAALSAALVRNGFTIFVPFDAGKGDGSDKAYYCYYYMWIKHNDNNKPDEMGPMEFAVVRNNIYAVTVDKMQHIGHPFPDAEITTDPDALTPDTDDEVYRRYFSIECKVLPWVKREVEMGW